MFTLDYDKVADLLLCFIIVQVFIWEAVSFLLFYIIYIVVVVVIGYLRVSPSNYFTYSLFSLSECVCGLSLNFVLLNIAYGPHHSGCVSGRGCWYGGDFYGTYGSPCHCNTS